MCSRRHTSRRSGLTWTKQIWNNLEFRLGVMLAASKEHDPQPAVQSAVHQCFKPSLTWWTADELGPCPRAAALRRQSVGPTALIGPPFICQTLQLTDQSHSRTVGSWAHLASNPLPGAN